MSPGKHVTEIFGEQRAEIEALVAERDELRAALAALVDAFGADESASPSRLAHRRISALAAARALVVASPEKETT